MVQLDTKIYNSKINDKIIVVFFQYHQSSRIHRLKCLKVLSVRISSIIQLVSEGIRKATTCMVLIRIPSIPTANTFHWAHESALSYIICNGSHGPPDGWRRDSLSSLTTSSHYVLLRNKRSISVNFYSTFAPTCWDIQRRLWLLGVKSEIFYLR